MPDPSLLDRGRRSRECLCDSLLLDDRSVADLVISFRRCGDYASGTNHTLRESLLHVNCLFRAVLTVSSIDSHRRIRQAVLGRLDVLLPQALHLARAHFGRFEAIGSLRRDPRRRGAARRSQGECQFASRKDRARRLVDKRAPPSERVAKAHIESHTTGRLVSLHMGTLVLVSSVHQGLDCGIFLVEPLHFVGRSALETASEDTSTHIFPAVFKEALKFLDLTSKTAFAL